MISIATIQAWVIARVPDKVLIDLTNQYVGTATAVDTTRLDAYIEDAIEFFHFAVGDEPYEEFFHDRVAIKSLVIIICYLYAESSSLLNFHMSWAQNALMQALTKRYMRGPKTPTSQEKQQFTNHQTYIRALPKMLLRENNL